METVIDTEEPWTETSNPWRTLVVHFQRMSVHGNRYLSPTLSPRRQPPPTPNIDLSLLRQIRPRSTNIDLSPRNCSSPYSAQALLILPTPALQNARLQQRDHVRTQSSRTISHRTSSTQVESSGLLLTLHSQRAPLGLELRSLRKKTAMIEMRTERKTLNRPRG